ncbi:hypothetical protein KFK09_023597 [Dendrobium nobile]|uniref:Uncharacterized protein n=1 Tax=Dendrobium nobile TaxID=94219 RepID=A0A8T3ABG6_DENNO|nr:hypothetical protein KFK09_023597 [Dendrobium nobile]
MGQAFWKLFLLNMCQRKCNLAGTPLHHAAKKGLDGTIILLLSHGANPLVMNDDCQTPLDLARAKGNSNVVRAIQNRICLFVGWLREIHGPSILEAFSPQYVSKKIFVFWAVAVPCDSRNPTNPRKYKLAIYPNLQLLSGLSVIIDGCSRFCSFYGHEC